MRGLKWLTVPENLWPIPAFYESKAPCSRLPASIGRTLCSLTNPVGRISKNQFNSLEGQEEPPCNLRDRSLSRLPQNRA